MLAWLLAPLSLAAPLTVVDDAGAVVSTVTVPASVAAVKAVLETPTLLATLSGEGISVRMVTEAGACAVLDYTSESRFTTVEYRLQQCRVPDGLDVSLISSSIFSAYDSTWRVVPAENGSTVTHRLLVQTTYFLPEVVIRQSVRSGVDEMMSGLQAHFAASSEHLEDATLSGAMQAAPGQTGHSAP